MKGLELKVPPGLLFLAAIAAMVVCRRLLPGWTVDVGALRPAAAALALLGGGIALTALASFGRARTTANPLRPEAATRLVAHGVYRFTRNPMYLGMALLTAAAAARSAHPLSLPILAAFVWYLDRFQIRPEERRLRQVFGGEYEAYARRVRRWI